MNSEVYTRRPRRNATIALLSLPLLSPAAVVRLLGTTSKDNSQRQLPLPPSSSIQNRPENANVPALPNSGSNRSDRQFLSLLFACASSARLSRAPPARASCLVRVRISSRWLPQQRLLPRLSAFACGNLRCRRRPRDKIAHSGKNCILVYNAKAVPPPVSGSSRSPIFVPTLSAADNQAAHEVD